MWGFFMSDEKVLNLESGEVTQVCEYTKSHWIVLFKNVECFVNYISIKYYKIMKWIVNVFY